MASETTKLRCTVCEKGKLVSKEVEYDVGPLLDLKSVVVTNLPALVCTNCQSVTVPGGLLDLIALEVAAKILVLPDVEPLEFRYIRKLLGDTQEEFAKRLGVNRATVNRWENGGEPIRGPDAYAVRSHAFFRLRSKSASIEAIAPAFTETKPHERPRSRGFRIEGANLLAGALTS